MLDTALSDFSVGLLLRVVMGKFGFFLTNCMYMYVVFTIAFHNALTNTRKTVTILNIIVA